MDHMTHQMREQYWRGIIKECNESGECKEKWLTEHGINSKSFYYWQRKIRSDGHCSWWQHKHPHSCLSNAHSAGSRHQPH